MGPTSKGREKGREREEEKGEAPPTTGLSRILFL